MQSIKYTNQMKSFSLGILSMAIAVTTMAQSSFQISGHITGIHSGMASLHYVDGNEKQIQSEIKNGLFVFKGVLPEPEYLNLSIQTDSGNRGTAFFAGNENIDIVLDT